jgi:hypothetical protein
MYLSVRTIFFSLAILSLLTTRPGVNSWSDASRMSTVQALVEKHSFIIDESTFKTGDKVFIGGHFFSDKPAFPSIMGAIVYLPLFHLGIKLDKGWNLAYYLITLLTVKLLWLAGLMAFYMVLRFTTLHDRDRLFLTLALGIASLYFTWSSVFNNHSIAAASLIIGFYFFLKAKQSTVSEWSLFFAGLFLSLAGAADNPMAAFYVGFSFPVLLTPHLRRKCYLYLLPLIFTAFPALFVNYYISGSVVPVQINRSYFEYPGSPWLTRLHSLSGMSANRGLFLLSYGFNCLLGSKGFLLYNPLLFVALPYLVREIKGNRGFRQEALVIGIVSLVIVSYYFVYTNNYNGASYSIRWFVPLLPLLFFFIHPFFETFSVKRRRIFIALFCLSAMISAIGLVNTSPGDSLGWPPVLENLKTLFHFIEKWR